MAKATWVIDNSGPTELLVGQVERLWADLEARRVAAGSA